MAQQEHLLRSDTKHQDAVRELIKVMRYEKPSIVT